MLNLNFPPTPDSDINLKNRKKVIILEAEIKCEPLEQIVSKYLYKSMQKKVFSKDENKNTLFCKNRIKIKFEVNAAKDYNSIETAVDDIAACIKEYFSEVDLGNDFIREYMFNRPIILKSVNYADIAVKTYGPSDFFTSFYGKLYDINNFPSLKDTVKIKYSNGKLKHEYTVITE